jgi:hypothetical protein
MIKFLNNIENLLQEILNNKRSIIFFYLDNCQISASLFDCINNNNYDLTNNIIFVNKTSFLKNNNSKFIKNSLHRRRFKMRQNNLKINYYIIITMNSKRSIMNCSCSSCFYLIRRVFKVGIIKDTH